jgi:hypothetical protein
LGLVDVWTHLELIHRGAETHRRRRATEGPRRDRTAASRPPLGYAVVAAFTRDPSGADEPTRLELNRRLTVGVHCGSRFDCTGVGTGRKARQLGISESPRAQESSNQKALITIINTKSARPLGKPTAFEARGDATMTTKNPMKTAPSTGSKTFMARLSHGFPLRYLSRTSRNLAASSDRTRGVRGAPTSVKYLD